MATTSHHPATQTAADVVLRPRAIITGVAIVVVLLNIANVLAIAAGADTEQTRYWLMALEWNPSTWCASALLAATAAAAFFVGRDGDARRWNTVAGILLAMSVDEIATVHERLAALPGIPGIGTRGWAGAGLVLVGAVAFRLLPWAVTLDRRMRRALLLGGALFVLGAVGFEVLSGNRAASVGEDGLHWALATVEEDLELAGVLVVLHALLRHLKATGARLNLTVG